MNRFYFNIYGYNICVQIWEESTLLIFENIFLTNQEKPLGLEEIENNKEKINRFNKVLNKTII